VTEREVPSLHEQLCTMLNVASRENVSNTPDFVLARFMLASLEAFETATNLREAWYKGAPDEPSELPV